MLIVEKLRIRLLRGLVYILTDVDLEHPFGIKCSQFQRAHVVLPPLTQATMTTACVVLLLLPPIQPRLFLVLGCVPTPQALLIVCDLLVHVGLFSSLSGVLPLLENRVVVIVMAILRPLFHLHGALVVHRVRQSQLILRRGLPAHHYHMFESLWPLLVEYVALFYLLGGPVLL